MPKNGHYHQIESTSRDELRSLQLRRLQGAVRDLYERSGFYREKWRQSGFEPGDLKRFEDISRLPFVTKAELREEQAQHPPFGRLTTAGPETFREVHPSTGTTGRQVRTIWTESDIRQIADFTARFLWGIGVRPGDMIQNAFSYGLWIAGMAVHYAARQLGCLTIPIGGLPASAQMTFLRELRPKAVFATPSFGLYVGETFAKEGVDPRELGLSYGAFGGEAGVELGGTRQRLEHGLGIRAYDIYGLSEIAPTMACECEAQAGLHWAEDHFLIEIVNPETGQPAPEGDIGMLVISHLNREGTPMVRYATNDVARYTSAPCACGRTHGRSIGGILGRNDDLVVYRGAKFYPTQVEEVVRRLDGFTGEYVIEVRGGGGPSDVTVVAETSLGEGAEATLRAALKEALLVTPHVRLAAPGELGRTEFKAKRLLRM